jgi:hypothetical protein
MLTNELNYVLPLDYKLTLSKGSIKLTMQDLQLCRSVQEESYLYEFST